MDHLTKMMIAQVTGEMMGTAALIDDREIKAILQECAERLLALAGFELTEDPRQVRPIPTGRAN